jgi:sarcosine oxidase subunit gamma
MTRRGALDEFDPMPEGVLALPPASRWIFRGRAAAIAAAGNAFGTALPQEPCRAATAGERAALWLGPDEWLLLAPESEGAALGTALARVIGAAPHSLVEIGHRQVALEIAGRNAETLLSAGCPLDLDRSAFPVGMCTRTLFAKTEIVLWRQAEDRFRLEVARSFAAYLCGLLAEAAAELAAGVPLA